MTVSDDELPARTPSPAEQVEKDERARLLFRLLDRLAEDKRMVLLLVEVEGMTAPEVAEALQLPLNTVYSRLRRARREFSAAFEADRRRQR
jgi:RNA polymerase sigma-70 factor (ECF subfamily)